MPMMEHPQSVHWPSVMHDAYKTWKNEVHFHILLKRDWEFSVFALPPKIIQNEATTVSTDDCFVTWMNQSFERLGWGNDSVTQTVICRHLLDCFLT